jgi:hypothetical protein
MIYIIGGDAAQMVNNVADGFQYTEVSISMHMSIYLHV